MTTKFLRIRAHGLPEGALSHDNGTTSVPNDVVELGGPGIISRLVRRSRKQPTPQGPGWPFGEVVEWWSLIDGSAPYDEVGHPQDIGDAETLETTVAMVLGQSLQAGLMRIRFADRVLFLPPSQWPALRIASPHQSDSDDAGEDWEERFDEQQLRMAEHEHPAGRPAPQTWPSRLEELSRRLEALQDSPVSRTADEIRRRRQEESEAATSSEDESRSHYRDLPEMYRDDEGPERGQGLSR